MNHSVEHDPFFAHCDKKVCKETQIVSYSQVNIAMQYKYNLYPTTSILSWLLEFKERRTLSTTTFPSNFPPFHKHNNPTRVYFDRYTIKDIAGNNLYNICSKKLSFASMIHFYSFCDWLTLPYSFTYFYLSQDMCSYAPKLDKNVTYFWGMCHSLHYCVVWQTLFVTKKVIPY